MKRVHVVFKHWKTGEPLHVTGILATWVNEQSDRIVVETEYGVYEDIIKDSIIKVEEL